ncbi:MAG: CPBP family intramembrane metalloprotease [Trueperaceae bacterium]|nr:MAG: CPBP family intramembrane metalloprotease [Trueperaceae bacterium]
MNLSTKNQLVNPWIYFAATFAWTWLLWGIAILFGAGMDSALGFGLLLLGVTGPMVTGIAFTYLTRDAEGRRDYWKRVVGFRRIPFRWYLVILLFVPILNLAAAGLDVLTGGSGATWGDAVLSFASNPLSIVPSILFASLIPFLEELGWRGYVLDRLQERHTALVSSLILGVVWSSWHLPLFFVEGSYQSGLGVGTLAFWLFMVGIVPLSVAFTWIYNHTRRSTLAVILFHSMINFTGELIALTERADTLSILLWCVAATGIAIIWGAKTLSRHPGSQPLGFDRKTV